MDSAARQSAVQCGCYGHFSEWRDLEAGTAIRDGSPEAPGVVQVSVAKGFVDYPGGRDELVFQTSAANLRTWLEQWAPAIRTRAAAEGYLEGLRFRCQAHDDPEGVHQALLADFLKRRGAAPRLNS